MKLLVLVLLLTLFLDSDKDNLNVDKNLPDFSCIIGFSGTQNYSNCNGECYDQPCAEITFNITGVHSCPGFYTSLTGFKVGNIIDFECGGQGSGTWSSTSPSYTTY